MFIAKWYSEEHSKEYFGIGEDIARAIDSLNTSYNDDNCKEEDIPFNDIKLFEVTSIIVEQQKVYYYKRKE